MPCYIRNRVPYLNENSRYKTSRIETILLPGYMTILNKMSEIKKQIIDKTVHAKNILETKIRDLKDRVLESFY